MRPKRTIMNRKNEIIVTIFFILMIFSVGIMQALYELKKGETVQFFNPLEDTFIIPIKNAKEIASLCEKLKNTFAGIKTELNSAKESDNDESDSWVKA